MTDPSQHQKALWSLTVDLRCTSHNQPDLNITYLFTITAFPNEDYSQVQNESLLAVVQPLRNYICNSYWTYY